MCTKNTKQSRSGIDTGYSNLNTYTDLSSVVTKVDGICLSGMKIGKLVILYVRYDSGVNGTVITGIPNVNQRNVQVTVSDGSSSGLFIASGTSVTYEHGSGGAGAKRCLIVYVTNS